MNDERLNISVEYGVVTSTHCSLGTTTIKVKCYDYNTLQSYEKTIDDRYEKYNDFKGLYTGEEVVILTYTYTWTDTTKTIITGIVDKKKYDHSVRLSQRLPEGWICEPEFKSTEQYGIIDEVDKDSDKFYFRNDTENTNECLNLREYFVFADRKVGNKIVKSTYACLYPNGEPSRYTVIRNLKQYNEFLEEFNKTRHRK